MTTVTPQLAGQAQSGPDRGENPLSGTPLRSVAVVAFLIIAALIALGGRESIPISQGSVSGDVAASLSVTSSELAQAAHNKDGVYGATGGYVPGVGIVITTEIDELPGTELTSWTRSLVAEATRIDLLPEGEEIIFLLDVAGPTRTSRLVSLTPADLDTGGEMSSREAPATSTAPLEADFGDTPTGMASVDNESESGSDS